MEQTSRYKAARYLEVPNPLTFQVSGHSHTGFEWPVWNLVVISHRQYKVAYGMEWHETDRLQESDASQTNNYLADVNVPRIVGVGKPPCAPSPDSWDKRMPLEAILTYDEPLLRRAVFRYWWRSVGPGILIAMTILTGALAILLADGDTSWKVGAIAATVGLGGVVVTAVYFVHYRETMRRFRRLDPPKAQLVATDDHLTMSSSAGVSTIVWDAVSEVWQYDEMLLLLFSSSAFVTLPLADIGPKLSDLIVQRVGAAGGKVR